MFFDLNDKRPNSLIFMDLDLIQKNFKALVYVIQFRNYEKNIK